MEFLRSFLRRHLTGKKVMALQNVQCRPELCEQWRRETDVMDASARTKVRVGADERLRQLGRVRKENIFLLLFTVTALLCGALL